MGSVNRDAVESPNAPQDGTQEPAPWRPEWRRRPRARFGYRDAVLAVGEAKRILEGDVPPTPAQEANALEVMRAIVADEHGLRQARVGAARLLERHEARKAEAAETAAREAELERLRQERGW